ncbi:MAG: fused MFS/spermidine synthase [Elusimicrobia bacterium]|nr:fused MFS/spermidine synthase [Elusimicrobiota bacterium]
MARFSFVAFLGAFLLFQIELIAGQFMLPLYGGGYQVWTASMLCFQGLLLLGYLYATIIPRRTMPGNFLKLHVFLLGLAAVLMPWRFPSRLWVGNPSADMLLKSLYFLGLPFLLLSATSSIAQAMYAQTPQSRTRSPYAIYGWSNLGAVLGLASYPLVFETCFRLRTSYALWRLLFGVYAGAFLLLLRQDYEKIADVAAPPQREDRPPAAFMWVLLPAATTAAMIAVTDYVNTMVPPMPLTWTLPLLVYLLAFAAYYFGEAWSRHILRAALAASLAAALLLAKVFHASQGMMTLAGANLLLLLGCLLLNRELYGMRPAHGLLPRYYLAISAGGFLGTAAISLVLPAAARNVFAHYADIDAALMLFAASVLFLFAPRLLEGWRKYAVAAAVLAAGVMTSNRTVPGVENVYALRNFYGTYHVKDDLAEGVRIMIHGATPHGMQYLDKSKSRTPLLYYGSNSPVADVFAVAEAADVALVGLGAGNLAPYARDKSRWTVYEIDPDVVWLARKFFTFLAESKASIKYRIGDGRMLLEQEPPRSLDMIVLDAFNGANIPFHLLTREALEVYGYRLRSAGVLVVHCSSNHLDLPPVLAAGVDALGMEGFAREAVPAEEGPGALRLRESQWFAGTRDRGLAARLLAAGWSRVQADAGNAWSDDYKNVFRALR